ncbi:MAG: hypothetical protein ACI9N9_000624 [Enterobacterales bacterium]|jgi:hypothetical protein
MYHYTDCCLDNIWLINGYRLKKTSEGEFAEINDLNGLHEAMMNMKVGSILNMSESFEFVWSISGWKMRARKESSRKVA